MPKYINADDIYNGMREHRFEARHITIGEFVDYLPSADVVEIKHGVWKTEKTRFGFCFYCDQCEMLSYWAANFCPHCGADMRRSGSKMITSNRLEILKSELETVKNLHTLCFDLKEQIIAYYENEIKVIEEYGEWRETE